MVDQHVSEGLQALASPVRRRLLEHLADLVHTVTDTGAVPGRTAAELAEITGLHVTTVRFHLERLVDAGFVETRFERSTGAGRPRKVYTSRLSQLPPPAQGPYQHALARLHAEVAHHGAAPAQAEEAGYAWAREHARTVAATVAGPARSAGAWLAQLGRLVDVLGEWGYGPDVRTTGPTAELTLQHCPFLALADDKPDVVCAIHRGLLRGTLEAIGEDRVRISVRPKISPHACLAHLRTMTPLTGGRP